MIVSIHQPAHLPWLGYLDKIARSDLFIYLDDVQFEKNSFTNRNRVKTPQGAAWLTIPVKARGHIDGTLLDLRIDETKAWRAGQLRTIEMNYRRARGFETVFPILERWLADRSGLFAEFCFHQLEGWVAEAGLTTPLVRSGTLAIGKHKSELVLELCRSVGATTYLSGKLGRGYLDEAAFAEAGITIRYQDFIEPAYRQLWGEHIPNLSAVDYWMNVGSLDLFGGDV